MSSLRSPSVPCYRNPSLRPGLAAMVELLGERGYTPLAVGSILDHTAAGGTPTGCIYLDPSDEADVTEAFVAGLPSVDISDEAWDGDESIFLDVEMLASGRHPTPFLEPDAPDDGWFYPHSPNHPALRAAGIMPIAGGAPEDPGPTDADRRDFEAWLSQVDQPCPPPCEPETPRRGHLHPDVLGRVHMALYGTATPFHA